MNEGFPIYKELHGDELFSKKMKEADEVSQIDTVVKKFNNLQKDCSPFSFSQNALL